MTNKLDISIADQNPFKGLTAKQIDLYFLLKRIHTLITDSKQGLKDANIDWFTFYLNGAPYTIKTNEDGSFEVSNDHLAFMSRVHVRTVVRSLNGLSASGIIILKHIPNGGGTIRKIYWKGLPHE